MSSKHMLIIDPQNDFCDLPSSYWAVDPLSKTGARLQPSLPIVGAHADMQRLARFVERAASSLDRITVTLDSHLGVSIERPSMWLAQDGGELPAFTPVRAQDVQQGRYRVRHSAFKTIVMDYLLALEQQGRFTHMVWPAHCEVGTWGHQVHADILRALHGWEAMSGIPVAKVLKGMSPYTEHYSALVAEVPDVADPASQLNQTLLNSLEASDMVIVGGEAASHCVRCTLEHIVQYGRDGDLSRYVLLEDCVSVISGFEDDYQIFLQQATKQGLRLSTSTQLLAELQ